MEKGEAFLNRVETAGVKVGILTFHRADNYGAVLQNMALIKALETVEPGCDVRTVDYRNSHLEEPYHRPFYRCDTRNPIRYADRLISNLRFLKKTKARRQAFDEFRRLYLKMTPSCTGQQLEEAGAEFDLLITGSDQVWNSRIVGSKDDNIYSLGFGDGAVRVSYAASSGSAAMIGSGTMEKLRRLDVISVREAELREYLEQNLQRTVRQDSDPVFLLTKQQWLELLEPERIRRKPYIFAYCVGNRKKDVSEIARALADEKDCDIVYLDPHEHYGRRGVCMYEAGPLDFVRLIRDAETVVASSFHAAAFSAILGKALIAAPDHKTGVRVVELLRDLGMERCIADGERGIQQNPASQARMEAYRNNSSAYLAEILELAKARLR